MLFFFASIILSFVFSYLLTPVVRNYFIRRHWVESPLDRQQKTGNATATSTLPRGGGIPVFIAVTAVSLVLLPLNRYFLGFLAASFLALIVGVWDDIRDISPKLRLLTNFLVALIVVASGIGISYLSNPLGGIIDLSAPGIISFLSNLVAVLWIVWCMNITGWSAGIEGQLPGFVSISAVVIGLLGLRFSSDINQWPVIILAGTVAGAYLGFLPFNFAPQSVMPGYSGKSLAGLYLAVLSILSGAKVATLILLLGIPMLDAVWAIIRRLLAGKPIYRGDGSHLHHRLLQNGWTRRQIAFLYWSLSFIFGIISLFLNSTQKFYAFIGIIVLFVGLLLKFYRRI